MKKSVSKLLVAPLSALLLASFVLAPVAEARERGGGGGGGRQAAKGGGGNKVKVNNNSRDVRSTNVRNTSVNNVNVKKNTNVNVNVDNDRHRHGGWDNDYHPIATAAAVTATVAVTSAVIGSIVRTVPPNCVPVNYHGMIYQQCGNTWYQPQYVGPQVQYVVVAPIY